jgi:TM2 domain-containing membrane protein YozV
MSTEPDPTPVDPTPPSAPVSAPPPAPGAVPGAEKKMVSGILAILLGWLGIHKFYLGYQKEGIIMCAIGVGGWLLCGIPRMVVSIIGIIEGVMYLTKTDEQFIATYVTGRKPWF